MKVNHLQLAEGLLTDGKNLSTRVTGGSMSPVLRSGDTIYVEPVKPEDLSAGDIILYKRDEHMIAHRLVDSCRKRVSGESKVLSSESDDGFIFLTKGDTFSSADAPVRASDILGRVYAVAKCGMLVHLGKGIFSKFNKLAYYLSPLTAALYERIRGYKGFYAPEGMVSKSREEMFLVSLLQADFSPAAAASDTAMALKDFIDLSKCLTIARDNRVSQKIYAVLKKVQGGRSKEPETGAFDNFIAELRRDYFVTAARNTILYSEFNRVVKELGERQIDVIVMKGAALAELVYPDIGIREMSDIDLLLKTDDLEKANDVLEKMGYTAIDLSFFDGVDNENNYLTTRDYRSRNPMHPSFHIHWHLVNSSIPAPYAKAVKMDQIWKDAVPSKIAGAGVLCMSPHHFLVHLCEHAMRVTHSASKLIYLLDIATLVSIYESVLDWRKIISTSREFSVHRFVYNILSMSKLNMGIDIPEWVLLELGAYKKSHGERLFYHIAARGNCPSGLSYLVHLEMNEGIIKKVSFIFRTLFPPAWVVNKRLPCPYSRLSTSGTYRLYLYRLREILSLAVLQPVSKFKKIIISIIICALVFMGISTALANDAAIEKNNTFTSESGVPEYLIAAGDLLEIKMWQGFEAKNYDVVVRKDGFITFGLVDVKMSDMTARQAEAALKNALSVYIREPRVEVSVKEYKGRTVMLLGAIQKGTGQGIGDIYPLKGKITLSRFIVTTGGFTKPPDLENIEITKLDGTKHKINLYEAMLSGDKSKDIILESGDIIHVPTNAGGSSQNIFIFGEVANPGVYPLTTDMTLLQAIGTAKGYKDSAVIEDVRVIRGGLEKPQILSADIKTMLQKGDLTKDITLLKNDIIYVPRTRIANWNVFIGELAPTLQFLTLPFAPYSTYQSTFPSPVR